MTTLAAPPLCPTTGSETETDTGPVSKNIDLFNERSIQRSTALAYDESSEGEAGVLDIVRDVTTSPSQQLDTSSQRSLEDRIRDNRDDVRIHTGPSASKAREDINARAFTVGNHIAFTHGEYDPGSPEGQHVLAHELAHVRQQTGGTIFMLPEGGDDPFAS